MAAVSIVYFLYILSGFSSPTSGGDFTTIASFPTKEACETARGGLDTQLKGEHSTKSVVCISSDDLDAFAVQVTKPYYK